MIYGFNWFVLDLLIFRKDIGFMDLQIFRKFYEFWILWIWENESLVVYAL